MMVWIEFLVRTREHLAGLAAAASRRRKEVIWAIARAMKECNPDGTWKKVELSPR